MKIISRTALVGLVGLATGFALAAGLGPSAAGEPPAATAAGQATAAPARVAIQVDEDDPHVMKQALANAANIRKYYESVGRPVTIEIVAFGPGLNMLRSDTSPVADRVSELKAADGVRFSACANTIAGMSKHGPVPLLDAAEVVPSGAVRLMELQEAGYSYLRP